MGPGADLDDREQDKVPLDDGAGRRREVPMSFRELSLLRSVPLARARCPAIRRHVR